MVDSFRIDIVPEKQKRCVTTDIVKIISNKVKKIGRNESKEDLIGGQNI